jgi:hypothetical protein
MQEFNEASTTIFAGKKGVNGVVMNGVENEAPCLLKGVAVK